MNILYGVAGEGLGHSSRATELIPFLEKKGHKVLVVTYGQAYEVLKNKFDCLKVEGIMPHYEQGKIRFRKTLDKSLDAIWNNLENIKEIKKTIEQFKPNLCISDMEPIVPIARRIYSLPLISFDNQHRLIFMKHQTPLAYWREKELAKNIVEACVSKADAFIIVSFTKGKLKKTKEKVFIVSPLIRKEIRSLKLKKGKSIVVYLSREIPGINSLLKQFKNEKFIIYSNQEKNNEENLIFKKISPSFIKDLANCKAVIGTAGFSLISESLFLKKPFFAIPLKGQFEQTLNAVLIKQENYGNYSENPKKRDVSKFLMNLNKYETRIKQYKMNPDEALEVLDKLIWLIEKQQLY
jgi:uncharacterized protein (TIGR00661 family)